MGFSIFKLISPTLSLSETQSLKRDAVEFILSHIQPERIIFFGSSARNKMTTNSDLDVAIIFKESLALAKGKSDLLSHPFRWPVDYLFFTVEELKLKSETGGITEIIASEGEVVYERAVK
jgi:predicted nucleotidyltransferase